MATETRRRDGTEIAIGTRTTARNEEAIVTVHIALPPSNGETVTSVNRTPARNGHKSITTARIDAFLGVTSGGFSNHQFGLHRVMTQVGVTA